jgi:L-serine dehydratase
MIGPSSSHTAGAARIGRVAANVAPGGFNRVRFLLHGSFAQTYRGHGTDRALIAGVLGMMEYDERIPNAFEEAKKRGLPVSFEQADLGDVHENSVRIEFMYPDGGVFSVTGSSLGGGQIVIVDIGGYPVSYTGSSPAVLVREGDKKGIVSSVSTALANRGINIGTMSVVRKKKNVEAIMLIETDGALPDDLKDSLRALPDVFDVRIIPGGAV